MYIFTVVILLLTLLMTTIIPVSMFTDINPSETSSRRCRYTRSHQLYKVDCTKCELDTIPQNLYKGIEIMDFRHNQLGRLPNGSLDHYTSLQEIYFQKNGMAIIEEVAFEPTQHLQILDLSRNQLKELPLNIFTLPELRKLYLDNNLLTDRVFNSLETTAPIEHLDLGYNKLTKIPKLKSLVDVKIFNLTGNGITKLSIDDLAPLCSLEALYVKSNQIKFNNNDCGCKEVDRWLDFKNIKLDIPLNCPEVSNCSISVFSDQTLNKYNDCLAILKDRIQARHNYIVIILVSLIIGIVVLAGCIGGYYIYRRRKNSRTSNNRSTTTISPPIVTTVS